MKMFKIMAGAIISLAGFQVAADTGLYLEPGVSYQELAGNIDYPAGNQKGSQATANGFGIILKGGVHVYEQFFVAADARYGLLRFNDNSNEYRVNASSWDIAPVIGYQMPGIGMRIFAGYVLAGNLDPSSGSHDQDFKLTDPQGWRVGAGLKVQMVSVNIEWQQLRYQTTKWEGQSSPLKQGDIRYNPQGIIASVTFPLEFN